LFRQIGVIAAIKAHLSSLLEEAKKKLAERKGFFVAKGKGVLGCVCLRKDLCQKVSLI